MFFQRGGAGCTAQSYPYTVHMADLCAAIQGVPGCRRPGSTRAEPSSRPGRVTIPDASQNKQGVPPPFHQALDASAGRAVSPVFLRDAACSPGDPPPLVPVLDGKPPLIGACLDGCMRNPLLPGEVSECGRLRLLIILRREDLSYN